MKEPQDIAIADAVLAAWPNVRVMAMEAQVESLDTVAATADRIWRAQHDLWSQASRSDVRRQPHVAAYRNFAVALGLDPDRQPPSIQGLIDRGLRGKPAGRWPQINPIVDLVNTVAVQTMVALGCFDAERISGTVRLDLTDGGEQFQPLGGEETKLPGNRLVLADDARVLSLFAQRDGVHQAVGTATRRVLVLGCAVPGVSADDARVAISMTVAELERR